MKLSDFSIQNPVKVTVGVILICLYGIIALFGVPVQLTPDVSKPKISIETRWPGAAPQEIEKEIIEKQEDELKSVEGMTDFQSECSDGEGEIDMEFAVGTDMGKTVLDVANALQQIRDYPEDAEKPRIRTVNIDDSPIAWMSLIPTPPARAEVEAIVGQHPHLKSVVAPALVGDQVDVAILYRLSRSHAELEPLFAHRVDPTKLRNFAEDYLKAAFERVPGVANSNVYGGQEERMEVIVNPARLAARRITVPDLRLALAGENRDISAGDLWEEKSRVVIRTLGQFETIEAVENVIVAQRDGAPVYVKDVATVRLGHGKPQGIVRQRGVPSLAVNVQKEDSANVLDVMAGVKLKLAELNAGLLRTRGLQLVQVYDQTEYINSATRLVRNNIFVGGALAVMVLLLFLRSGRSTLVVALAIPICVVGTFLIVRVLGRSINVISLAGMSFAVGMVVDNAIVVLENIFSHYQRGEPPRMAASRGTTEVWGAVLASTLTTLAVFLPVVFVEEQAGQLFRDIAIAISAAVAPEHGGLADRHPQFGRAAAGAAATDGRSGDPAAVDGGEPVHQRGRLVDRAAAVRPHQPTRGDRTLRAVLPGRRRHGTGRELRPHGHGVLVVAVPDPHPALAGSPDRRGGDRAVRVVGLSGPAAGGSADDDRAVGGHEPAADARRRVPARGEQEPGDRDPAARRPATTRTSCWSWGRGWKTGCGRIGRSAPARPKPKRWATCTSTTSSSWPAARWSSWARGAPMRRGPTS